MSNTLYVTPAQVLAAKLAIELSEEDGEEPDEALKAIANAEVVTDESQSATGTQPTEAGVEPGQQPANPDLVEIGQSGRSLIVVDPVDDNMLTAFSSFVDKLRPVDAAQHIIVITGRAGSGKSRVLIEPLSESQIQRPAPLPEDIVDEQSTQLQAEEDPSPRRKR
jgi:hypothetical protein